MVGGGGHKKDMFHNCIHVSMYPHPHPRPQGIPSSHTNGEGQGDWVYTDEMQAKIKSIIADSESDLVAAEASLLESDHPLRSVFNHCDLYNTGECSTLQMPV